MHPLIEQHLPEIVALCRKYRVKRLELFGSAASGKFDPARSDIDFFYEFPEGDDSELLDRYFGMIEGLEKLFGRRIDFVSALDATNPYFLEVANRHRQTLYAA
jgi:predicted nucleotidyltransferase